jgi:hypothetical protein
MGELECKMSCHRPDDKFLIELGLAKECPECGKVKPNTAEECMHCKLLEMVKQFLQDPEGCNT